MYYESRGGTYDFGVPTSEFWAPTPDFRVSTSNFQLLTSEFCLPTSEFRLPTSDFQLQNLNDRSPTCNLFPWKSGQILIFVQLCFGKLVLSCIEGHLLTCYENLISLRKWEQKQILLLCKTLLATQRVSNRKRRQMQRKIAKNWN